MLLLTKWAVIPSIVIPMSADFDEVPVLMRILSKYSSIFLLAYTLNSQPLRKYKMKKILFASVGVLFITQTFALDEPSMNTEANKTLLPSPFPIYIVGGAGVINHPYPGGVRAFLPTDNSYTMSPGCYIACYSHQSGVYAVSSDISVIGQIRVKGEYNERICQPDSYKGKDISTVDKFKILCSEKFKPCKHNKCWAGGDTGGWLGIQ